MRRTDCIDQSANSPQPRVRPGGEFFTSPTHPGQRRYEALRAYLHDGEAAAVVAQRFGYTTAALNSAVRDFRAGGQEFFLTVTPGPKSAPGKDAARARIIELRADGHSIDEIAVALTADGLALNRTGIAEVIAEHGLPRLWRRPDIVRGGPRREVLPRAAELLDFSQLPDRSATTMAGLLLTIPDLLALDLPALVTAAGYPGTQVIPAVNYLLSLLALKLTATRRVSHVEDLAADPGAALFAGLTALPKTTALTSYSYRLSHAKQAAFLTALDKATLNTGLATGEAVNLDFRSRLFPGVNDSGRRFFSITTKISRRDPRPCPHEYHPPTVYTPRSTRCSPPVTTWRPPWSRWRGSVPSCCCRPRWRRRSPASSAGTATPARPAPRAPRPVSATATARPQ